MPTKDQILRNAVIAKRGRHCMYCGRGPLYKRALHVDHILARSVGGTDDLCNLAVTCKACNMRKGAKDASQYVRDRLTEVELELSILQALRDRFC